MATFYELMRKKFSMLIHDVSHCFVIACLKTKTKHSNKAHLNRNHLTTSLLPSHSGNSLLHFLPAWIVVPQRKLPARDWFKSRHVTLTNTHCWPVNTGQHWSRHSFLV